MVDAASRSTMGKRRVNQSSSYAIFGGVLAFSVDAEDLVPPMESRGHGRLQPGIYVLDCADISFDSAVVADGAGSRFAGRL